jgi:hypothetical protein
MFTTAQNNPALRVVFLDAPVQPAPTSSPCSDSTTLTSIQVEPVHDVCVRMLNWHVKERHSHGMPAPVLAPGISVRQCRISVTDCETFYRFGDCNEYNWSLLKNRESFSRLFTSHTFHRQAVPMYRQIMETLDMLQQNLWRISSPKEQPPPPKSHSFTNFTKCFT